MNAIAFVTLARVRAVKLAPALLGMDTLGWTERHLLADLPGKWSLSFTAHDEQILGYSILSRKERPHLHSLMVRADRRGQGIGSTMMGEILRRAGPGLTVKVHAANERALRFYRRHGFVTAEPGTYILLRRYGQAGSN